MVRSPAHPHTLLPTHKPQTAPDSPRQLHTSPDRPRQPQTNPIPAATLAIAKITLPRDNDDDYGNGQDVAEAAEAYVQQQQELQDLMALFARVEKAHGTVGVRFFHHPHNTRPPLFNPHPAEFTREPEAKLTNPNSA